MGGPVESKVGDQPAHPCGLIGTFVVRCPDSIHVHVIQNLKTLVWVLPGRRVPRMGFSYNVAH